MTRNVRFAPIIISLSLAISLQGTGIAYATPSDYSCTEIAKNVSEEKDDAFAAVVGCKGKSAATALNAAEDSGIDASFEDSYGVNVTSSVKESTKGSEVLEATVTEVKTYDLWIFGKSATFVLDYVDPAAKRERDEREAKTKAAEDLKQCEGKSARSAKLLSDTAGYDVKFYDSFGIDVTRSVVYGKGKPEAADAIVTEIEVVDSWLFIPGSATVKLDYVDPDAAEEREKAVLFEANTETIMGFEGKTVGEAVDFVNSYGFGLVVYDAQGKSIAPRLRYGDEGPEIRKSIVNSVTMGSSDGRSVVTLQTSYINFDTVKTLAKENGYPAEVTFSNISAEVEDENPTSYDPSFFVTVKGTITSNDTWTVSDYYLPSLGVPESSFKSCAGMELDDRATSLQGGETRGFTYHYRLYYDSDQVVLKTDNYGVKMNNSEELISAVTKQFERAKQQHDENLAAARAQYSTAYETNRSNTRCYYTDTGRCYHTNSGCPSLSRSRNIYETTIGEAESWGLEPCDRCR